MKSDEKMEISKETTILGGWNQPIKTFPPLEIPLDAFKTFIEFKVKGPTVEIPLQQYEKLKQDNMRMQGRIWDLENQIRDLERETDRQEEIDGHTDVVTRMVADEITEKVMEDLLQLSNEQKQEIREKWRKSDRFGHKE